MINKISASVADALADVRDSATVMVGDFRMIGIPNKLIDGLIAQGGRKLSIVNNNAGNGETDLLTKQGASKIVERYSCPLTGIDCVIRI